MNDKSLMPNEHIPYLSLLFNTSPTGIRLFGFDLRHSYLSLLFQQPKKYLYLCLPASSIHRFIIA